MYFARKLVYLIVLAFDQSAVNQVLYQCCILVGGPYALEGR